MKIIEWLRPDRKRKDRNYSLAEDVERVANTLREMGVTWDMEDQGEHFWVSAYDDDDEPLYDLFVYKHADKTITQQLEEAVRYVAAIMKERQQL